MPQEDHPDNDAWLIRQAVAGNKEAFGRLYERYSGQIFTYLFVRMGDQHAAMDMTEMVFLKAWENLPGFGRQERGLNFRAWLYRMAHNAMVDHFRTHKTEIDLDALGEQADRMPHAAKLIEQAEMGQYLLRKLEELDEVSRQVLVLRFYAEMNAGEIAKIMDISAGNVRIIQYRALKKMRELMDEDDE